jgi:hypothetical protein
MSWLYAVPPVLGNALQLRDGQMAPFVMTRLEARLKPNKKHKTTIREGEISFETVEDGRITQVLLLHQVLETAFSHLRETRNFDFPEAISYCHRVPDIIRRLALDIVDPLLAEPTFSRICKAIKPVHTVKSEARKGWLCVMFLSFIDELLIEEMCAGSEEDDVRLVRAAAASLQQHLRKIGGSFSVALWTGKQKSPRIAVVLSPCPKDVCVFSLNGEPDTKFAARLPRPGHTYSEYCGPLFLLNVRDSIGPRPSSLFTASFWRGKTPAPDIRTLRFKW